MVESLTANFAAKKKIHSLKQRLWRKKKDSCIMATYLFDKVQAAETLGKMNCPISENELKQLIFNGLPAQHYGDYITVIKDYPLDLIGDLLIEFENGVTAKQEEHKASSGRRRRLLDRSVSRGDIIVIMTLVLSLLFVAGANPSANLLPPVPEKDNCSCGASVARCSCIPYLFLSFEGIVAMGFTLAVATVIRVSQDFLLFGWIFVSMVLTSTAFLFSVCVATPSKFRFRVIVVDVLAAVFVVMGMNAVRYWRPILRVVNLAWKVLGGGMNTGWAKMKVGWNVVVGGLQTLPQRFKQTWEGSRIFFGGTPASPPYEEFELKEFNQHCPTLGEYENIFGRIDESMEE